MLFIIGGKANNTDIYETFRAMTDALRDHLMKTDSSHSTLLLDVAGQI